MEAKYQYLLMACVLAALILIGIASWWIVQVGHVHIHGLKHHHQNIPYLEKLANHLNWLVLLIFAGVLVVGLGIYWYYKKR